jgi:hypothetical protein
MFAHAVEDAGDRLHDLRRVEHEDGAVAAIVFALALVASVVWPAFALPFFAGGAFLGLRALIAGWRRWDLFDQLLGERDAYVIAEVRARAQQEAGMVNRRRLSHAICSRLELAKNPRVVANAGQLAALADELVDPDLILDPDCAVACSRLLTDYATSPLINLALPAEDLRSRLARIRAGLHRCD